MNLVAKPHPSGLTLDGLVASLLGGILGIWAFDHLARLIVDPTTHVLACRATGIPPPPYTLESVLTTGLAISSHWPNLMFCGMLIGALAAYQARLRELPFWRARLLILAGVFLMILVWGFQGRFSALASEPGAAFYLVGMLGSAIRVAGYLASAYGLARIAKYIQERWNS